METAVTRPVDWTYKIKLALNYDIFNKDDIVTAFIDKIGNMSMYSDGRCRLRDINYDESTRIITFTTHSSYHMTAYDNIREAFYKTCANYKTSIDLAITSRCGSTYTEVFDEIMERRLVNDLGQLIYIYYTDIVREEPKYGVSVNDTCFTIRLY